MNLIIENFIIDHGVLLTVLYGIALAGWLIYSELTGR